MCSVNSTLTVFRVQMCLSVFYQSIIRVYLTLKILLCIDST
uniref:Uncharacterized protein n=1 Tax=Anguilla anguilla TaxID=7936 RepID=A0A0E9WNV9_ANGAN